MVHAEKENVRKHRNIGYKIDATRREEDRKKTGNERWKDSDPASYNYSVCVEWVWDKTRLDELKEREGFVTHHVLHGGSTRQSID